MERNSKGQFVEGNKVKSLIGEKFNKLLVLDFSHTKNNTFWKCRCECGNLCIVNSSKLKSGWTKSCGCLKKNTGFKKGHKSFLTKESKKKIREKMIGRKISKRTRGKSGKEFERVSWAGEKKYCSKKCMSEHWQKIKKRVFKNNPAWKNGNHGNTIKKRYKKYLEDKGINIEKIGCEICGCKTGLIYDLHHIVFRSEIPNHLELHNPRNIIYVCRSCHFSLHSNKRKAREKLVKKRKLEELFNTKL